MLIYIANTLLIYICLHLSVSMSLCKSIFAYLSFTGLLVSLSFLLCLLVFISLYTLFLCLFLNFCLFLNCCLSLLSSKFIFNSSYFSTSPSIFLDSFISHISVTYSFSPTPPALSPFTTPSLSLVSIPPFLYMCRSLSSLVLHYLLQSSAHSTQLNFFSILPTVQAKEPLINQRLSNCGRCQSPLEAYAGAAVATSAPSLSPLSIPFSLSLTQSAT